MTKYCVSDLHAGDRGPRDNFNFLNRESRFYDFLDWVESQRAELYILGDLFDFWQMNVSASLNEYVDLLDRFEDMQATYIVGNHDNAFVHFIGTERRLIYRSAQFILGKATLAGIRLFSSIGTSSVFNFTSKRPSRALLC